VSDGYLLIDGSNVAHANAANKVLKVGDTETQAIYGFLKQLRPLICRYPTLAPIVLWDGRSWRYDVYPEYKDKRDKPDAKKDYEQKAQAIRESCKKQIPQIKRGLELLGVRQMHAMNLEADDLAGILCKRWANNGKKVVLISGDKDWIQLVRPGVAWRDMIREQIINFKNLSKELGYKKVLKKDEDGIEIESEWIGVPSARAWLEVKAMMGDISDNLPGVGGIGEKGAIDLVNKFGSVTEFWNRANLENLKLPKKLKDFATDADKIANFQRNMWLMDLNHPQIPAPAGMTIKGDGKPKAEEFGAFCGEFMFQSILTDLETWLEPFTPAGMKEAA
jgi:5'-3' exonuclease